MKPLLRFLYESQTPQPFLLDGFSRLQQEAEAAVNDRLDLHKGES